MRNLNILFGEILLLLFTACSGPYKKEVDERTITVSIEPMRFLTEQIAGNDWNVCCMIPKGNNPETYEPLPEQLIKLAHSKAYFRIGFIGFEQTWMDKLQTNAPQMEVYDTSQGIDFIREKGMQHGNHYHVGGIEPHVWSSPTNVRRIAANIYHALCQISPEDSLSFLERWEKLDQQIVATDSIIRQLLNQNEAHQTFLIYHPTLSYFARDYGLQQICIEESGKEPSPARMKTLIDRCKQEQVKVVFIQREFDTRNTELIAAELGAQSVMIDPLNYNWAEELITIAKTLANND